MINNYNGLFTGGKYIKCTEDREGDSPMDYSMMYMYLWPTKSFSNKAILTVCFSRIT